MIYCCACACDVQARLTDGREIYPHRGDLADLPFWRCKCGEFVGCHHKTKYRTRPLGCIPSPEMRNARKHIHSLIDPEWQSGRMRRGSLYAAISRAIGWEYHTAELRTIEDARVVYRAAASIIAATIPPDGQALAQG